MDSINLMLKQEELVFDAVCFRLLAAKNEVDQLYKDLDEHTGRFIFMAAYITSQGQAETIKFVKHCFEKNPLQAENICSYIHENYLDLSELPFTGGCFIK